MLVRFPFGKCLLLFLVLFVSLVSSAQSSDSLLIPSIPTENQPDSIASGKATGEKPGSTPVVKPKRRLVAALLCLALGPFGMHRLYLGTKPHVAAAYTLTLGGGLGLVPLIDFFHIVFDPNLYKYKDNDKFIMWVK